MFNSIYYAQRCPAWKRLRTTAVTMSCIAVLATWSAPKILADEWDKKTNVTISAPVEVPGKVLTPGTYVFKLLNSSSNRNIVQIYDRDEKMPIATILAVPGYRVQPADKPLILFEERPSGTPPAVKAWFYPGDNYGQEFVYPHTRAVALAKRTNQNVLSMGDEMTKNMATASPSARDSGIREMQNTEVSGVNPSGDRVDLLVVITPAADKQ